MDVPTSPICLAVVVAQHAAEALPTLDITNLLSDLVAGIDDPVVQPLVVPLPVVVGDELN